MNIKRIVLFTLALYVIGAVSVLAIGFLFGDPNPNTDSAQSLLNLNNAAQSSIADRTNEQVDQVTQADPDKPAPDKVSAPTTTASNSTPAASKSGSSSSTGNTPTPTTPTNPTTTTPEPAPKPACGSGGTCKAAQVAVHNSQGNCWVMYNSRAYNVTSYVNQHPGGSGSFDSSTCGKDVTAQLQGQAGSASSSKKKNHPSSAYNTLNSYFVADVSG